MQTPIIPPLIVAARNEVIREMPMYPRKLWRRPPDAVEGQEKRDLLAVGRQIEGLWPILEALEGPGFLLADHLALMLYSDRRQGTKIARSRLKKLWDHGLVNSFRMSRSDMPDRGGSMPLVHCMTKDGAQLLTAYRQVSMADLLWHERQELLSMAAICHRLDQADLHCALLDHCGRHDMDLRQYRYEPRFELPRDKENDLRELRPDALAEVEGPGRRWSLLMEVDRNTERPRKFAERVWRYEAFYTSGEWERWLVDAPVVLVIATEGGAGRVQALREATAAALGSKCTFRRYRFATMEDLYQVGRSVQGYTPEVLTAFDRPVCVKVAGGGPVPLFDGGGSE
jgi:hypothetical protein